MLRGKRLVFVGDSLNRNMWDSLVCILSNSVKNKSRIFEASGRQEFQTEDSYSFIFTVSHCYSFTKLKSFIILTCKFDNDLDG